MTRAARQAMPAIRILLVDNNPQFLKTVRQLLADDEAFEIVGGTYSAAKGLELVARLRPDVVVVDLTLPLMNGLEVTRRIKAGTPVPLVIIVTLHDQEAYGRTAEAAGADGFVPKWEVGARLPELIRRLMQVKRDRFAAVHSASTDFVRE
ncbi:MAG: response regulator transcription factor [Nitrospirae bacterium]|nr:MAG: response regulator transcription factor [Nitrospirota bacterium]